MPRKRKSDKGSSRKSAKKRGSKGGNERSQHPLQPKNPLPLNFIDAPPVEATDTTLTTPPVRRHVEGTGTLRAKHAVERLIRYDATDSLDQESTPTTITLKDEDQAAQEPDPDDELYSPEVTTVTGRTWPDVTMELIDRTLAPSTYWMFAGLTFTACSLLQMYLGRFPSTDINSFLLNSLIPSLGFVLFAIALFIRRSFGYCREWIRDKWSGRVEG